MSKKVKIWIAVMVTIVLVGSITGYLLYRHDQVKPKCAHPTIKGNISYRTGAKIYHLPGERLYNKTVIDTSAGERWFCTEQDAKAAGWRHTEEN